MAEAPHLADLKDQVTCPVCLDVYKQPKSLVCQHALCVECIEGLPVSREEGEYVIRCPVCRDKTVLIGEGTANLRTAFQTNAMIELYERTRQNSAKTKQAPAEGETCEYPKCTKHHRDMDMFCEKCQQVICAVCGAREHSNHKFDLITDLFPRHQKEITGHLDKVRQQIDDILDNLDVLYSTENDIVQQGEHAKTEIDSFVQKLTRIINKSGDQLKESVEEMVQHKVQLISTQRDKLEKTLHQLKTCEDRVAKELQDQMHQVINKKAKLIKSMIATSYQAASEEPLSKESYTFIPSEGIIDQCGNIGVVSKVALPSTSDKALPSVGVAECRGKGSEVAMVGTKRTFTLHLPTAPDSTISCYLYNKDSGPVITCNVSVEVATSSKNPTEMHAPVYKISYTPTCNGLHHIIVRDGKVDIPCDQYAINVLPSPRVKEQNATVLSCGELRSPCGIAMTSEDMLVVSERDSNTIVICDKEGENVTRIGQAGKKGQLNQPTGLAVTSDNHIVVSDTDNHRILKFSIDGKFVHCVGRHGKKKLQFDLPCDLAVDSRDRIYVCDVKNYRVQILCPDLKFCHMFGEYGNGPGQLSSHFGIAIDTQDVVYVCETFRLQKFTVNGECIAQFENRIASPRYLAMDSDNIVYVSDTYANQVVILDSEGGYLGRLDTSDEGTLKPTGVAVDACRHLYVSDHTDVIIFH